MQILPIRRVGVAHLVPLVAAAEILLGLHAAIAVPALPPWLAPAFASLFPLRPAALIAGGLLLLMLPRHPAPQWVRQGIAAAAALPLVVFAPAPAAGVGWGLLLLHGSCGLLAALAPWFLIHQAEQESPPSWQRWENAGIPISLVEVVPLLETWSWLLALGTAGMGAVGSSQVLLTPVAAYVAAAAIGVSNAVLLGKGHPAPGARRILHHLMVVITSLGLLFATARNMGHAVFALMVVMPPVGAWALGTGAGRKILLLGTGVVVASELYSSLLQETPPSQAAIGVGVGSLTFVVAAELGVRFVAVVRRVMEDLVEARSSLRRQLAQLSLLSHLNNALRRSLDLRTILENAVTELGQVSGAARCFILLCRDRALLPIEYEYDAPGVEAIAPRCPPCLPILHAVVESRRPIAVPEVAAEPGLADRLDAFNRYGVNSVLAAPVQSEQELLGVLVLHNPALPVWSPAETDFVISVANQIGVAMAQARSHGLLAQHHQDLQEAHKQLQVLNDELTRLADRDPLTDLFNRRRLSRELTRQLKESATTGTRGALLLVDLNDFKYVNDAFGHTAGDEAIRSVAGLLQGLVGHRGLVARLSGDEFAILLPRANDREAREMADEILTTIRHHSFHAGDQLFTVSAGLGIALFPDHGKSPAELLANADAALYQAKRGLRNSWSVYVPDGQWQVGLRDRLSWEKQIWDALEGERFVLHAQPVLDLKTNQHAYYELLVRMVHENGELIAPGAFLGVAERIGLIQRLDRWVVGRAIQLLATASSGGYNRTVAVNLSGLTLADGELLQFIQDELATTGVNPENLVLEITETSAISDLAKAREFITRLKQVGCRFALDDFGTGFSSFHLLKSLPVDYIKIDGSFIIDLPTNSADQHFVRAMVDVAHGLGKQVVAEFVENQETLDLLRHCGVDYGQGYHIGRPDALENVWSVPPLPDSEQWPPPEQT